MPKVIFTLLDSGFFGISWDFGISWNVEYSKTKFKEQGQNEN